MCPTLERGTETTPKRPEARLNCTQTGLRRYGSGVERVLRRTEPALSGSRRVDPTMTSRVRHRSAGRLPINFERNRLAFDLAKGNPTA